MTGARGGVIGVKPEQSIAVMRTRMPMRYDPSDEDPWLNAVGSASAGGRAARIEPVCARPEVVGAREERERQQPDEVEENQWSAPAGRR